LKRKDGGQIHMTLPIIHGVPWLVLLHRIMVYLQSILPHDTLPPFFYWFSSVLPGKWCDSILKRTSGA